MNPLIQDGRRISSIDDFVRPDFIVIGAMKCGTSTVCAYLEDHPNVFMVPNSEPNFFSRDVNFSKGAAWYSALFQSRTNEVICGEGSNSYSHCTNFPHAASRMASYNPKLKIVYLVRHPLERIISAWIQERSDSGDVVPDTLERALTERSKRFVEPSLYWIPGSLPRRADLCGFYGGHDRR